MLAALNRKTEAGTEEVFAVHGRAHRKQRHWGLWLRFNKIHRMLSFTQNFDFSRTTHMLQDGHRYKYLSGGTGVRVVQNQILTLKG